MFWDRYVTECSRIGKKPNAVAKELGISSGAVTAWKYGGDPSITTLAKMCEYFKCSVEYMTGYSDIRTTTDSHSDAKTDSEGSKLSGAEFALYGEIQALSEDERLDVLDYIRFKKQQKEKRR